MTASSHVFFDGDVPLAATVHRNSDDPFDARPGVIVLGSWLTVKEQMPDLYAAALAERGYTAVTFDFAGFGASGGGLRQTEMPTRKMSNLAAAIRWVSSLSIVRPGGPGVLAVCASAQYTMAAMASGVPMRSFASVAGWFHDVQSIAGFYGGAEGVAARLDRAAAATAAYLEGDRSDPLPVVPAYAVGDERAGMFIDMDYYANPDRGAIPQWRNEMTEVTWDHWLTFDGLAPAEAVTAPSLFVHSDGCVFPDNIKNIAKAMKGPAQLAWGDGEQIDFYDQPPQTAFALDAVHEHFIRTLTVAP